MRRGDEPSGPTTRLVGSHARGAWAEMNERTFAELKRAESTNPAEANVLVSGVSTNFVHALHNELRCGNGGSASKSRAQLLAAQRDLLPSWYEEKINVGITDASSGTLGWAQVSQREGSLRNARGLCFNGQPLAPRRSSPGPSAPDCEWETPDSLIEFSSVEADIEVSIELATDIAPLVAVSRKQLFLRDFKLRSNKILEIPYFRTIYENVQTAREHRAKYSISVLPTADSETAVVFLVPDEVRSLSAVLEDLSWHDVSRVLERLSVVDFLTFYVPRIRLFSGSSRNYDARHEPASRRGKLCRSSGRNEDLRFRVTQEMSMSLGEPAPQREVPAASESSPKKKVYQFDSTNFPKRVMFLERPFLVFVIDKSTGAILTAAAIHDPSNRAAISAPAG